MCFSTLSNSKACNPNCFLLESRLNDLFFFFGDLLLLELVAEDEEAEEEEEAADAAVLVVEEAEEEEEDEVPGAVVPTAVPNTVSLGGAEAASNDNGMSSSRMDGAAGRAMCGWSTLVRWPLPCFLCFPCCFPCFFARLWAPPPRDEEDEEEDEAEEEDVVVEEEKEEAPFNCRRLGLM